MGRAEHDLDEQEEERRLFYVGITRAEKRLYLSYAQRRYRFGELNFSQPSMFLREIHPDTIEYVDSLAPNRSNRNTEIKPKMPATNSLGVQKPKSSPFFDDISQNEESFSQIEPDGLEIRAGMKVIHGKFGKGTVYSVSGNGEKREAIVMFQGIGKKQLLLKYAKLQPDNS